MTVTLNGAGRDLPDGATIADAVTAVAAPGRGVAVAVNGTVVPRRRWPEVELRAGDVIEVLTAVQGG